LRAPGAVAAAAQRRTDAGQSVQVSYNKHYFPYCIVWN